MRVQKELPFDSIISEKKKILVTGGTRGIGRRIVEDLLDRGHFVATCARDITPLGALIANTNRLVPLECDLKYEDSCKSLIQQSYKQMKGLDILILSAAVPNIREDVYETYRVNCAAPLILVQEALDILREVRGQIVFLTSGQAQEVNVDNPAYGLSKAKFEVKIRELLTRSDNSAIHYFSVNPGSVFTKMHKDAIRYGKPSIKAYSLNKLREGSFRRKKACAKIVDEMSLTRKKISSICGSFSIPISRFDLVKVTDDEYQAFLQWCRTNS